MNVLTQPDIARLLDVKEATVRTWRWRGVLPPPDGYLRRIPYWQTSTIEAWARETGRMQ